jgi:hypothetical protein
MGKNLFAFLMTLLVAGSAFAGSTGDVDIPTIQGKGVAVETNNTFGAGTSTIMIPIVWVSDDTAVNETTGVAVDTGDEACAVVAMDCADVVSFDEAGASGDEFTASACNTDLADTTRAIAYCY